ncbi:hypothetical protein CISG_06089 [Coccidioides immitis RMSCC 3703]|uniref:Uncharacterized protein n=1 Tax=Coccidioides immitis RMSCC 3703 TaxID=454286 RepID=A0A0J8QYW4_COCIT|nr:hypothetical protein CISG_06089 [Coccidioides immitis RMSCC 3703]
MRINPCFTQSRLLGAAYPSLALHPMAQLKHKTTNTQTSPHPTFSQRHILTLFVVGRLPAPSIPNLTLYCRLWLISGSASPSCRPTTWLPVCSMAPVMLKATV